MTGFPCYWLHLEPAVGEDDGPVFEARTYSVPTGTPIPRVYEVVEVDSRPWTVAWVHHIYSRDESQPPQVVVRLR